MLTMEGIAIGRAQTTNVIKYCKKHFVFLMNEEISISVTIFFIKEKDKNHLYRMEIDEDVFESSLGSDDYDFDSFLWDTLSDSAQQQNEEKRIQECINVSREIHNSVISYMKNNKIIYKS